MVLALTTHDSDVDVCPIRGDAALALVGQLTRTSWTLAGRTIPDYSRAEIPIRFVERR